MDQAEATVEERVSKFECGELRFSMSRGTASW
jgi:hypothetical protein